jgi:hypothetical protein
MGFVESPALKVAMPKKLKTYVFDAGNSNTGVAGVVIAVRAFNRRSAVRLANDFLRKYQYEPLEIKVNKPGGSSGLVGVDWALFCVGPNLRKRDIDEKTVLD